MGSEQKQRLSAEERKTQILDCAVKVFAGSNYRAAKVADIAEEAGISEAAIYKYYPSKKSIFIEILGQMSQKVLALWKSEFDKEENVLEAIRKIGVVYYEEIMNDLYSLKVHLQAISEIEDAEIAERGVRNSLQSKAENS